MTAQEVLDHIERLTFGENEIIIFKMNPSMDEHSRREITKVIQKSFTPNTNAIIMFLRPGDSIEKLDDRDACRVYEILKKRLNK